MSKKHLSRSAAYLVLKKDGKFLLPRRFNTGYEDGNYGLVAGHVESGETYTDALVRESKEEANIELNPADVRVVHVMHRLCPDDVCYIDVFFFSESYEGEVKNTEPEKCDELSWHAADKMPENIIGYVRQALDCIERDEVYSEYKH